ncbi:MAG: hypothetical protein ACR2OZ_11555 [Verrucomicrobiales bacterium]
MPPFPELRDIAPPVEPPDPARVIVWSVFGAIVAVGLFLALIAWVRWIRRHPRLPPLPLSAGTAALRELGELKALAGTLDSAELAGAVSESLRHYLQRARGLLARYRTTDEMIGRNGGGGPPPLPFLRTFEPVLRGCDRIKYGRIESARAERMMLVEQAIAAVEQDQNAPDWRMPNPELKIPTPPSEIRNPASPPPPPLPVILVQSNELEMPEPAADLRAVQGVAPEIRDPKSAIRNPMLPPGPPPLPANAPSQADAFSFNPKRCGLPVPY